MSSLFIIISSALALISPIVYSKAILKGEAKPHRTTRFILLLITVLATASLFAQGDKVAVWLAGVSAIQSIVVFVLSLKFGMGGWGKIDLICFGIALLGIFLWQTTSNPLLGLYASILADFTGIIPALIKTYRFPKTEIVLFYLIDVFAALFNVLAVEQFTVAQASYPIYLMIINLAMVLLIIRPVKHVEVTAS